jgi:hypothetical protein
MISLSLSIFGMTWPQSPDALVHEMRASSSRHFSCGCSSTYPLPAALAEGLRATRWFWSYFTSQRGSPLIPKLSGSLLPDRLIERACIMNTAYAPYASSEEACPVPARRGCQRVRRKHSVADPGATANTSRISIEVERVLSGTRAKLSGERYVQQYVQRENWPES